MNASLASGQALLLGGASHTGKATLGQLLAAALSGRYRSTLREIHVTSPFLFTFNYLSSDSAGNLRLTSTAKLATLLRYAWSLHFRRLALPPQR